VTVALRENEMKNDNRISDLGLAASLSALGHRIEGVDKSNPRRVVFVFEKSEGLDLAIELYWADQLLLNAADLIEHIRQLKGRIYA
jgi:uncharacterized protein DUF5659